MRSQWLHVHAGDVVAGRDRREWTVVERVDDQGTWVIGGRGARFAVEDSTGARHEFARNLAADVEIVRRAADTDAVAAAVQIMISQGMGVELLSESAFDDPAEDPPELVEPKLDRWKRYVFKGADGGTLVCTRASTIARTMADEYHLSLWKQRMVAAGVARRPDLIAGAAAADPQDDDDKSTLNRIAEQALEVAGGKTGANMGTAVHGFTRRLDAGEDLASMNVPSGPMRADLEAYVRAMAAHRLRPIAAERIVVWPEMALAGRFDLIVEQPPGPAKADPVTILDRKSAKVMYDDGWLEIAIQLAIYAHAPWMWDPGTGALVPKPKVDLNRALVMHMPIGKASPTLYAVNLHEGLRAVRLALEVRAMRKGAKRLAWLVDPEGPQLALHLVRRAERTEDLAALWDRFHPAGHWTEEVNAAAAAQWEVINNPNRQPVVTSNA